MTPFAPPDECAATVVRVDPARPVGGLAGYRAPDGGWRLEPARPAVGTRPWEPKTPLVVLPQAAATAPGISKNTTKPRAPDSGSPATEWVAEDSSATSSPANGLTARGLAIKGLPIKGLPIKGLPIKGLPPTTPPAPDAEDDSLPDEVREQAQ